MSPARASSNASPMAFSRSGSIKYFPPLFCIPTTMSLMILSGSSWRGHLLLAAGEVTGKPTPPLPEDGEERHHAFVGASLARAAPAAEGPGAQVLVDRELRE